MVASKQAYTVSAPWLNFNLADQFEQAFIDAGLMDDWFDSFETGSGSTSAERTQHRIIRIVYDANKKYGTLFHWFCFEPSGRMGYAYVHQWDSASNQALGVYGKERLRETFNMIDPNNGYSQGTHRVFATQVLSTTSTLTRYTSGVESQFSMFLLKGGNNFQTFFLMPPGTRFQPYIDLDLNSCGGLVAPLLSNQSNTSASQVMPTVEFGHFFHYENNIFAYGYSDLTSDGLMDWRIAYAFERGVSYALAGRGTDGGANPTRSAHATAENGKVINIIGSNGSFWITLPSELAVNNPDRNADATPVFADLPYSIYVIDRLPIDFGLAGHFTNNTMEVQDIFQVTAGVEEWEILANSNFTDVRNPSTMILARVV